MPVRPLACLLLLTLFAAGTPRPAAAQTQAEMNATAETDFKRADARLNLAYGKLRAALDTEGRTLLKAAQKAWLAFRDAEATFVADTGARGGSMAPLLDATTRQALTEARTAQLEAQIETLANR